MVGTTGDDVSAVSIPSPWSHGDPVGKGPTAPFRFVSDPAPTESSDAGCQDLDMELTTVLIDKPDDLNVIIGQAHFIKTVEDLHETLARREPGPALRGRLL